MNRQTPVPQPGFLARGARAVFFAVHLSPFKLIGGFIVLAMGFACVAGLFDGPDVASAAQSGITPGMLEAHYYAMRVIGIVAVFNASANLYELARMVRRHPDFSRENRTC